MKPTITFYKGFKKRKFYYPWKESALRALFVTGLYFICLVALGGMISYIIFSIILIK